MIKPKQAIKRLWNKGYFKNLKRTDDIKKIALQTYGCTCSNWSALLKSCSFLRKDKKGWIQKYRPNLGEKLSKKKTDYFGLFNIHQEIKKVSQKLFNDGHYSQAILEAYKKVNNLVKNKSGIDDDGKSLMMNVFNENRPILKFNSLNSTTKRNVQQGLKFLFAGAMMAIRNPKAHEEINQKDPILTMKYLSFASLLAKQLDESRK